MHWTLLLLLNLCAACALLNLVQWRIAGTVRETGLLVCGAWALQQAGWVVEGNSLALTLLCDSFIVATIISRRDANDWSDWAICLLVPFTAMVYVPEYIYGQTASGWWLNWSIVAIQMALGLPRLASARADRFVSHGPRRSPHGDA